MIEIIGILAAGILAGRFFRRYSWPLKAASLVTATVCVLIFVLGFSVGADTPVHAGLFYLLSDAVSLTVLGLGGSFAGVWILRRFVTR